MPNSTPCLLMSLASSTFSARYLETYKGCSIQLGKKKKFSGIRPQGSRKCFILHKAHFTLCPLNMFCLCAWPSVPMTLLPLEYLNTSAVINCAYTASVDASMISPMIPGPFRGLWMVLSSRTQTVIPGRQHQHHLATC